MGYVRRERSFALLRMTVGETAFVAEIRVRNERSLGSARDDGRGDGQPGVEVTTGLRARGGPSVSSKRRGYSTGKTILLPGRMVLVAIFGSDW